MNVSRLVTLCELYGTKGVDKATGGRIQRADISVVGVLLYCQMHNAKQFEAFLKHFVCTNYG
jgi:hypothetical protein